MPPYDSRIYYLAPALHGVSRLANGDLRAWQRITSAGKLRYMVSTSSDRVSPSEFSSRGRDCRFVNLYLFRTGGHRTRHRRKVNQNLGPLAIGYATETPPQIWRIEHEASGRPVVRSLIDDSAGPVVSLSHSQKYTIVAVANSSAIGVDLEVTRPKRYAQITEYLNWRSFAPRFPVDPGADEFFHFWTLWEAGLKASTIGNLFRPNEPFRTLADRVRAGESGEVEVDGWYTRSWTFPGAFWITLITRSFCRPTVRLCVMDEPRAATPFNSRACDLGLF